MAERPLRLAIVGCGDIAQYTAWFARLNPRIRLVAAGDLVEERVSSFARRFKIPRAFTNYQALLADGQLDAVYLATPHHLHAEMIAAAVKFRLPVFTEKPLTRTLAEGKEIARLAAAQGVKVGVNYQYRYDSGCHRLARSAQRGGLGAIHAARINVPWHRTRDYFASAAWHGKVAKAGGGTLITQGSHFLDLVLWALRGDRPRTAVGYIAQRKFKEGIEVEDLAQGIVEMESGALVQISSSMVASSEQAVRVELYGERGTATYSPRPFPHTRFRDTDDRGKRPPHAGVHALQRSLEGFRRWVQLDQPYLIPAEESLATLAVVEAIYLSAQTERREAVARYRLEDLA